MKSTHIRELGIGWINSFRVLADPKFEKRAKMDFARICFYLIHWLKSSHDKFEIRRIAPTVVFGIVLVQMVQMVIGLLYEGFSLEASWINVAE